MTSRVKGILPQNYEIDKGAWPWESSPSRLWSLADLIDCDVQYITDLVRKLQSFQLVYLTTGQSVGLSIELPSDEKYRLMAIVKKATPYFEKYEMEACVDRLESINKRLAGIGSCSFGVIKAELEGLRDSIIKELGKHKFAYIAKDNSRYFEQDKLFGESVYDAFPSIRNEIKDAGNCLAGELYTATVFHLMRVVEKVLRILARDRRIKIKKTPLDYAEWNTVIQAINKQVDGMAQKSRSIKKAEALEFYRGALGSFMGFKDAFRNHVSHSRVRYDEYEAKSVMNHVESFMQRLSSRLREKKTTPIAWKI